VESIALGNAQQADKTIMIFTEGTILKPKSWLNLFDYKSYRPIDNCVETIITWIHSGANIVYLSSRKGKQAEGVAALLRKYGFQGSKMYYRSKGESYKDIVEKLKPSVLIEDDCKSIGGAWQMCITKVAPEIKKNINSIVVSEFGGIDHLKDRVCEILQFELSG